MDIGQPRDYLLGTALYLEHLRQRDPQKLAGGAEVLGNVLLHETATVATGCLIGPDVVIGAHCTIGAGTRLSHSVLLDGIQVEGHCWVHGSIIGWRSRIGKWVRIEAMSVLGEDVVVCDEVCLNGIIVLPHKELRESEREQGKIVL